MRWLLVALLLAGCATVAPEAPPSSPTSAVPRLSSPPSATPKPSTPTADPVIDPVPMAQWRAMTRAGMVRIGCPMTRADLRRVEVNFHTFDGEVARGVLVVNRDVAADVAEIFSEIFRSGFRIHAMRPIEAYGGDDNASMAANNTSAYNCRSAAQANSNAADSPHANGRAIDINPVQNPWLDPRCDCFMPTSEFAARTPGKGKILRGGPVWKAFTRRGWIWQDLATADYQHFDTGYPSRPW